MNANTTWEPLNNPPVILRVAKRSRRIHTPHGSCGFAQDDKRWMRGCSVIPCGNAFRGT